MAIWSLLALATEIEKWPFSFVGAGKFSILETEVKLKNERMIDNGNVKESKGIETYDMRKPYLYKSM